MKERREFVRLDVDAVAEYILEKAVQEIYAAQLRDISCTGMKLSGDKPLPEQQELKFKLNISGLAAPLSVQGNVSWQKKLEDNSIITGIVFTQVAAIDRGRLEAFIESKTGKKKERREFIRCELNVMMKYARLEPPGEFKKCMSVDISGAGIKLLIKEKLDRNTPLQLSFQLPGWPQAAEARGTAAWIKETPEHFFETGVEFTEISDRDRGAICDFVRQNLRVFE